MSLYSAINILLATRIETLDAKLNYLHDLRSFAVSRGFRETLRPSRVDGWLTVTPIYQGWDRSCHQRPLVKPDVRFSRIRLSRQLSTKPPA